MDGHVHNQSAVKCSNTGHKKSSDEIDRPDDDRQNADGRLNTHCHRAHTHGIELVERYKLLFFQIQS